MGPNGGAEPGATGLASRGCHQLAGSEGLADTTEVGDGRSARFRWGGYHVRS